MAIHVGLEDLGSPQLIDLLAKDLDEKLMHAQQLEQAISTEAVKLCQAGCSHIYIVRWHEDDGATFRYLGQVLGPGMGQEAQALAKEKQGTVEVVEFRRSP